MVLRGVWPNWYLAEPGWGWVAVSVERGLAHGGGPHRGVPWLEAGADILLVLRDSHESRNAGEQRRRPPREPGSAQVEGAPPQKDGTAFTGEGRPIFVEDQ